MRPVVISMQNDLTDILKEKDRLYQLLTEKSKVNLLLLTYRGKEYQY